MSRFGSDLKIIIIGNSGTGKTSLVNKWTKNIFDESYQATLVSGFGFKIFEVMENYIEFNYGIQLDKTNLLQ